MRPFNRLAISEIKAQRVTFLAAGAALVLLQLLSFWLLLRDSSTYYSLVFEGLNSAIPVAALTFAVFHGM